MILNLGAGNIPWTNESEEIKVFLMPCKILCFQASSIFFKSLSLALLSWHLSLCFSRQMEDMICMGISTGSGSKKKKFCILRIYYSLLHFGQIFPNSCNVQPSSMKKKRRRKIGKSNVKRNRFYLFILSQMETECYTWQH